MNSFEAKITNPIDINTIAGGHFRLMPGQYRVTPDRQGGAELVRIDAKQPTSLIRLTPVQWGILEAARLLSGSERRVVRRKNLRNERLWRFLHQQHEGRPRSTFEAIRADQNLDDLRPSNCNRHVSGCHAER